MKFFYKAQTKEGKVIEGVIEAPDRFSAARQIRANGETPIVTREYSDKKVFGFSFDTLFDSIKLHEKILFTRNLAGMLTAGLSLYRALEVLHKQTKNHQMQKVLEALMKNIDSGGTLSSGMEKFPKVFSTLFVSMVRAGEESGSLPNALKEVGINLEKMYNLTRKIKGALTYPSIIVCAIVIIGILMLIFVVPTLTKTFIELSLELPKSTQFVIWISNTLSKHTAVFLGAIILLGAGIYYLFKLPFVMSYVDYLIVRLPIIGGIAQEVNSARTTRTLSSLLTSGVDVTKALTITRDVLQNKHYKDLLGITIIEVQKGLPISESFKRRTDLYPVMVSEMISVGEETGRLADMLLDIASFYEDEVDAKTKNLSTIIEPILMLFIGGAVGFFAISMITPMYSLVDSIK